MIKETIEAVKDFILSANTYFNKGIAGVTINEAGHVAGNEIVFPNDKYGDYFYIRQANRSTFETGSYDKVTDCDNGESLRTDIFIVACVRNADADKLIDNLIHTMQKYPDNRAVAVITESDDVIAQELAKASKTNKKAAQARIGNYTIVCLQVNIGTRVLPVRNLTTCILNPCSC